MMCLHVYCILYCLKSQFDHSGCDVLVCVLGLLYSEITFVNEFNKPTLHN